MMITRVPPGLKFTSPRWVGRSLALLSGVILLYVFYWVIVIQMNPDVMNAVNTHQDFPGLQLCLLKAWTGLPCMFCGLTRSMILLLGGNWTFSLQHHLLGLPMILLLTFWGVGGVVFPENLSRWMTKLMRNPVLMKGVLLLLACVWAWKLSQPSRFW